ncbi:MAG: efflux RND transporter permease subunit [bacterium]
MNLIRGAIRYPHTVLVATLLVVLFGVLALLRVPLQMRPSIDRPEVTVTTDYPGASPEEVEDKITRPIEEELNTVQGLRRLTSSSIQGRSLISLEFDLGINRDAALVDVLNKLGQVPTLPEEATKPVAEAVSSDTTSPMMWIGFRAKVSDAEAHVNRMRALVDDVIEPRLRRVEGVGSLIVAGGQEREVQIVVDLQRLAQRRIALTQLIRAIRESHLTVRGGPLDAGKREYVVWTVGRSNRLKAVQDIVLTRTHAGVIRVADVAEVRAGFKRRITLHRQNGQGAIALGVLRKVGANVPATAARLEQAMAELNRTFRQRDQPYYLTIMFTEVTYINEAVSLVSMNLLIGGALAVLMLLLFLGSVRSVLVIAVSIPVSLVTVFLVLEGLGRSMNIVSLAGLAFAVGMVVDNAIVVLENIHRYLSRGTSVEQSAYDGTREVALAIAASTITTISVFLPIAFLNSEAGQIFKDIAIAISVAVAMSLVVSLTIVPMLSSLILKPLRPGGDASRPRPRWERWSPARWTQRAGEWTEQVYRRLLTRVLGPQKGALRWAMVVGVTAIFVFSLSRLPAAEYLPGGNRSLIITLARPLPGMNLDKTSEAVRPLEQFLLRQKETERTFMVFSQRFSAVGVVLKDGYGSEKDLQRMLDRIQGHVGSIAGFRFLFPIKASIFRIPGKQFEVELRGADLKLLAAFGKVLETQLRQVDGVISVRSDFEDGALNLQVTPDRPALADQQTTPAQLAEAIQVAVGGLRVGYYLDRGREIDLTLIGPTGRLTGSEDLRAIPMITGRGSLAYVGSLARVDTVRGPTAINRLEMERAITLTVNLRADAPLSTVMERADKQVLAPLRASLPSSYSLRLGETADRLRETLRELSSSFLLALLISYLLMVALFRSFWYPLIIITTVPMGATGAFLFVGLTGVSFDTITMLGLIILAGIVVNNAILIVHQTLTLHRQGGHTFDDSIREGSVSRLRPITMTAMTSVLGMLPLALGSGPGAELYRGLGIAIVGGLTLSTVVTLFLVPALMGIAADARTHLLGRPIDTPPAP